MPFADHDNVVKAFPSNRANHSLGIRVLPRRAGRDDRLPDVQHLGLTRKSLSIDLVSVPNEIPEPLLQRARLEQLARRPCGGGGCAKGIGGWHDDAAAIHASRNIQSLLQ